MRKLNSGIYVCQLSLEKQEKIREALTVAFQNEGMQEDKIVEKVQCGLDSRLCDLSDTISINEYLNITLDNELYDILEYMQQEDRNGSYYEMFEEHERGEIERELIIEVCERVLNEWLKDAIEEENESEINWLNGWLRTLDSVKN